MPSTKISASGISITDVPMLVTRRITSTLLQFYDYPHPYKSNLIIKGYDKSHALRTAKMCAAVALHLGYPNEKVKQYQIACLLHDLGRAGLDQALFGRIWSWAKKNRIPTRPAEWRTIHRATSYGKETEAFLEKYRTLLEQDGICMNAWACEQVEMRLGFARRLKRRLRAIKPELQRLGITWFPWMEKVVLYYYYPEKLVNAPRWIRELGEILVACEQLEASCNRQRGKDYYTRSRESFAEAFTYLETLRRKRVLSKNVVQAIRLLTANGVFDSLLKAARGGLVGPSELKYLRQLAPRGVS